MNELAVEMIQRPNILLPCEFELTEDEIKTAKEHGYLQNYYKISADDQPERYIRFKYNMPNDAEIISKEFSDWTILNKLYYMGFCLQIYGTSMREHEKFAQFLEVDIVEDFEEIYGQIDKFIRTVQNIQKKGERVSLADQEFMVSRIEKMLAAMAFVVIKEAPEVLTAIDEISGRQVPILECEETLTGDESIDEIQAHIDAGAKGYDQAHDE